MMKNKHPVIFLDGTFCGADKKLLESLTPGAVRRRGVFETFIYEQGNVFLFPHHLKRFTRGARLFGITNVPEKKEILKIIGRLCARNRWTEARVRLMAWRENNRIRRAVVCQKYLPLRPRIYEQGFCAAAAGKPKNPTRYSHIKSLDYALCSDALRAAKERGFDEALFVNGQGELVETSRSNVFFVKKNVLHTPAVSCGCLNGVTRQFVIRLAVELGLPVKTGYYEQKDLLSAEEAFLTNAVMGLMPLVRVDGRKIGKGRPGPVFKQLRMFRQGCS